MPKKDKPSLGEAVRMMGSGAARKAGDTLIQSKKRKQKRLNDLMGELKKTRGGS
mgnify:CR=1 FL=1